VGKKNKLREEGLPSLEGKREGGRDNFCLREATDPQWLEKKDKTGPQEKRTMGRKKVICPCLLTEQKEVEAGGVGKEARPRGVWRRFWSSAYGEKGAPKSRRGTKGGNATLMGKSQGGKKKTSAFRSKKGGGGSPGIGRKV